MAKGEICSLLGYKYNQKHINCGGTTPDTYDRLHGLRPQGWSSPQDEVLWSTALLGARRKIPKRYPEDTA